MAQRASQGAKSQAAAVPQAEQAARGPWVHLGVDADTLVVQGVHTPGTTTQVEADGRTLVADWQRLREASSVLWLGLSAPGDRVPVPHACSRHMPLFVRALTYAPVEMDADTAVGVDALCQYFDVDHAQSNTWRNLQQQARGTIDAQLRATGADLPRLLDLGADCKSLHTTQGAVAELVKQN